MIASIMSYIILFVIGLPITILVAALIMYLSLKIANKILVLFQHIWNDISGGNI